MELDATIVSMLASVLSAIIVACFAYVNKKGEAKVEKRAEVRKQESRLLLKMVLANSDLSKATAIAVRDNHCDGVMSAALEQYEATEKEYKDFLISVARENL